MRILYDHQTFARQDFGGISRYFYELLHAGRMQRVDEVDLSLLFSNNAYISELTNFQYQKFFPNTTFKGKGRLLLLLNQLYSTHQIRKGKFDLLHPTYYDTYFLKELKNKPFTITFLDMIHEKFSDKFPQLGLDKALVRNKKILINEAPKVIAISEATRKDLVEIYGVNPAKIEVIHLGSSFQAQMGLGAKLEEAPYILFVGSREGYKNFHFCLESIGPLLKKYQINLVCAGGGAFTSGDLDFIQKLGLSQQVKYYGIKDSILANLYLNAEAFIFPSLYEGFGIPVLEAFSCNCPCLLSNGGSLPEVGGDAALYFDGSDADAIFSAVEKLINEQAVRTELIAKGNKRLQLFSWNKTYTQTMEFYRSII